MLESLLFNLESGSKPRYEMLEGKQYLVCPMVMLTEGVFNGSEGPLFYSEEELSKTPASWNHKPIVSYHPEINGQGVSACSPEILESRKVGLILNTSWFAAEKKLRSEAWLDEVKLNKLDPRVLEAIKEGQVVEISTGLFTDNIEASGTWNGKPFTAVAKNYRPDHLAILFDKKGACSIADGAGLLANEASIANREFSVKERKRLAKKGAAMKDGSYPIETEQDLDNAIRAIGRAKNPALAKRHIISKAKSLGKTDKIPDNWKLTGNEASFGDIHDRLRTCLANKHGQPGQHWQGYIEDVYPSHVVYGNDSDLLSHAYTVDSGDHNVKLKGEPQKVKRVTSYQPLDSLTIGSGSSGLIREGQPAFNKNEEKKMATREERVGTLMGKGVKEAHRKSLMEMDESTLTSFEQMLEEAQPTNPAIAKLMATGGGSPVPGTATPEVPGFNSVNQQLSLEQYLAQMPVEIRQIVRNGLAYEQAEKARLVGIIMNNARNPFKKEYLEQRSIEELSGIATLAETSVAGPQQSAVLNQRPIYMGAATVAPTQNQQVAVEEPLGLPTINYAN